MDILLLILTIAGICAFEIVSSVDNAIINAQVLSTMQRKYRQWFLIWGLLLAVFLVRGLLPWLIIWLSAPSLGPMGALTAAFSSDPVAIAAIETSTPLLLMGGGVFLLFLFLHWLFLEEKNFGLPVERALMRRGVWFFAIVSILLTLIAWFALQQSAMLGFAAIVGSTGFFIVHGFKQNAELAEKKMAAGGSGDLSDLSKLFYLEVIDATFSIDGIIGAFAFTVAVPLIIIGNGLGAVVVRQVTVGNIEKIKQYKFIKNGAMYSIFFLGIAMIADGFGANVPVWVSPVLTFAVIGYFFWKSKRHLTQREKHGNFEFSKKMCPLQPGKKAGRISQV